MLGHCHPSRGPLRIPVGEEIEIKIDYGKGYEKVRVRKNYPRVDKKEQERLRRRLAEDDVTFIRDMYNCSVDGLNECTVFLRRLWRNSPQVKETLSKRCRVLVLSLILRVRLLEEIEEMHDSDRNLQRSEKLAKEMKGQVDDICKSWENGDISDLYKYVNFPCSIVASSVSSVSHSSCTLFRFFVSSEVPCFLKSHQEKVWLLC